MVLVNIACNRRRNQTRKVDARRGAGPDVGRADVHRREFERFDARELQRTGPTYTLDTLRELQQEQPAADLVLIMGADQAAWLPQWHGWREILGMAAVAVARRPGATDGSPFDPHGLPDLPPGARFENLVLAPMDTSATEVRTRAAQGQDFFDLVPPAVARYIDQHHLYRST